jgi:hypothetical protein
VTASLFVLSLLVALVLVVVRRRRKASRSGADAAPFASFTVVAPELRERHRAPASRRGFGGSRGSM